MTETVSAHPQYPFLDGVGWVLTPEIIVTPFNIYIIVTMACV